MPSNAELTTSILALAAELGVQVSPEGLSNAKLADMLAELRAKKDAPDAERVEAERVEAERVEAERVEAERVEAERVEAERVEAERVAAERVEAAAATEPKSKPAYYMAPGKALTSMAGILSGDTEDEVKAEYLHGGDEALQAFVESGYVVKS